MTAAVTGETVADLKLASGSSVVALIKSTGVSLAV
ncbi:TOBE domain-containing protein [Streptomyces sp. NPDC055239]